MTDLMKRLQKTSTIAETDILSDSEIFNMDSVHLPVPMLNVAFSGRITGGLTSGLTIFAGESKHFKTGYGLLCAKAYLDKHADAVMLFYDSEFGAPKTYFESFGIDMKRVVHSPITDIEQLIHDIMNQLNDLRRGDHVFILVDSIGNLASRKEIDDAMEGNLKADFTRSKRMRSLFRMVVAHLKIKDLPMVAINHTYDEIGMFPKQIMGGGQGPYLGADNIFFLGRQQDKKQDGPLEGYNFVVNVEKGRFTREKSKIIMNIKFEGGINPFSGLLEAAIASGHVVTPTQGWYQIAGEKEKVRKADTNTAEFWQPVLEDPTFAKWIEENYAISSKPIMTESSTEEIEKEYTNASK